MRRHLLVTVKSSPRANVRHTLVLLDGLRLVVQPEGATRGRAALLHTRAGIVVAVATRLRACLTRAASWQLLA